MQIASIKQRWHGVRGASFSVLHWLKSSSTDACIALHDGHIVSEQYFGEMKSHTRHRVYSIVKPFLATSAANALSNGTIDANRLVTDYVGKLSDTGFRGATVRQVLDMQAGVEFRYWLEGIGKDSATWRVGTPEFQQASHEFARFFRAFGLVRKMEHEIGTGVYDAIFSFKKRV